MDSSIPDEATAERIEHERIRSTVETVLADVEIPPPDRSRDQTVLLDASDAFVALGPGVVPFLEAEVFSESAASFAPALHALGRMPSEATEGILRRCIERYDGQDSRVAARKVQWAVVGLAMQGRGDSLDVLDTLASQGVAGMLWPNGWTTVDVVAALLGDSGRTTLIAWIERYAPERTDAAAWRVIQSAEALGHIPHPSAVEPLVGLLSHPWWRVRVAAAGALGPSRATKAVGPLLDRIVDPEEDPRVVSAAALALEEIRPSDRWTELLSALERTEVTFARGVLYRTVALLDPERAVAVLRSHRAYPDRLDRTALMDACAITGQKDALPLLREGIADPDVTVAARAAERIGDIDSEGAIETLLATLNDPRWVVRQRAAETLVDLGVQRAAPRIADRLLREELSRSATDVHVRDRVRVYGEALVALGYTEVREDVRKRIDRQGDPELRAYLRRLVARLDDLDEAGNEVDAWTARLRSDDRLRVALAVDRLAEIGSPPAVRALTAAFDDLDTDLRVEILHRIGELGLRGAPASDLLARILTSPEFDVEPHRHVRTWAAWAAAEVDSPETLDALDRSLERRRGVDDGVVMHWARSVGGETAAARLRAIRDDRIRLPGAGLIVSQERIDRLTRDLEDGRSLEAYAAPPEGHVH